MVPAIPGPAFEIGTVVGLIQFVEPGLVAAPIETLSHPAPLPSVHEYVKASPSGSLDPLPSTDAV